MALVVWASFWWKAVSMSNTCFLWQASMDALVESSLPMALFISPCSQSTLSERVPESIPRWVLDCGAVGILAASGFSDARVREGEWLIGMALSGIAACGDACWEVATSLGTAKTGPSAPSGSSPLIVDGPSGATDVGLLGIVSPEAGLEVLSITQDKSSWSLVAILGQVAVSLGHSMAECGEEGGVEAPWGVGVMGIWSLTLTLERSTCNSEGLQTGLLRVSMSQTGSSRREICMGSKSPFRPLRLTTWSPHCRSLCTFSWLRCPRVLLLSMPSIMALMWLTG